MRLIRKRLEVLNEQIKRALSVCIIIDYFETEVSLLNTINKPQLHIEIVKCEHLPTSVFPARRTQSTALKCQMLWYLRPLSGEVEFVISLTHRPTVLNKETTTLEIFECDKITITKRFIIRCNRLLQSIGYDNHVLHSSPQTRFSHS